MKIYQILSREKMALIKKSYNDKKPLCERLRDFFPGGVKHYKNKTMVVSYIKNKKLQNCISKIEVFKSSNLEYQVIIQNQNLTMIPLFGIEDGVVEIRYADSQKVIFKNPYITDDCLSKEEKAYLVYGEKALREVNKRPVLSKEEIEDDEENGL